MLYKFNYVLGLLNHVKNSSVYEQICAVNTTNHIISTWVSENSSKADSLNSICRELQRISRLVEDPQVPAHVKGYLIECIIYRLNIMNNFSNNETLNMEIKN